MIESEGQIQLLTFCGIKKLYIQALVILGCRFQMDCPICTSATGLKDRKELVEHMNASHKNNPELIIERFADFLATREGSRELQ